MVSVIVPTRNSARTLDACLSSIRAQQDTDIELIVVDNASTDGTDRIAAGLADIVANRGPERSAQRNYGALISKGDYLLFVDSDMVLEPRVLVDCLVAIGETSADGVIIPEVSVGEGFWAACRALERSCYIGDDSIEAARFFPRKVFVDAGGFDENLTGPEDWDLTIRIAAGKRLPRSASNIIHDEGALRLWPVLAKKRYYAASSLRYWRKHRKTALSQSNLVFRPAFIRNWRRILRHPLLAAGILSLKALEAAAIVLGIVNGIVRGGNSAVSKEPSLFKG